MQAAQLGALRGAPAVGRSQAARRRGMPVPRAGLGDAFKGIFDFESWAPRSSQAWRLGRAPEQQPAADGMAEADVELLNQRLADARRGEGAALAGGRLEAAAAAEPSQAAQEPSAPGASFLQSTDEELADALNQRITQVAADLAPSTSISAVEGEEGGGAEEGALTGSQLAELCTQKWGKAYDMSFVRRQLPLGKTVVCLNVYHSSLGQRSFPMTKEEYLDKLDGIALCLTSWGQAGKVTDFLRAPPRPRGGMPSRPIVGNAVSVTLDLDEATIDEWFPQY